MRSTAAADHSAKPGRTPNTRALELDRPTLVSGGVPPLPHSSFVPLDTADAGGAVRPASVPGLAAEYADAGAILFRWRSYAPLTVLALLVGSVTIRPVPVGGAAAVPLWVSVAMLLGLVGLTIRGCALGCVPRGTSTRGTVEPTAATLNVCGLYSVVRHPLYVGNFFLWMGVAAVSGRPLGLVVTFSGFWLYYERIMMAEERFLFDRFGRRFQEWAERTPAFIPAIRPLTPSRLTFSARAWLGRDYPALYGFVAAASVVAAVRWLAVGADRDGFAEWVAFFGTGTVMYLIVHTLKRRTRVFEVAGR